LDFLLFIIRFFELELELSDDVEADVHQSVVRPVGNVYVTWLPWNEIVCCAGESVFMTTSEYLSPTAYATTFKLELELESEEVVAAILDPMVVPSSEVNALA